MKRRRTAGQAWDRVTAMVPSLPSWIKTRSQHDEDMINPTERVIKRSFSEEEVAASVAVNLTLFGWKELGGIWCPLVTCMKQIHICCAGGSPSSSKGDDLLSVLGCSFGLGGPGAPCWLL